MDDFYDDEQDRRQKAAETLKAETKVENDPVSDYKDDFEEEERIGEDGAEDVSNRGTRVSNRDTDVSNPDTSVLNGDTSELSSLRYASTDKLNEKDSSSHPAGKKPKRKGRSSPKKPKTHPNNNTNNTNKPPPLNLHHDRAKDRPRFSRERTGTTPSSSSSHHNNQDTMSDQEVGRRRGRRLHRRGQIKKYHSMEHAVEQAGRDRLEQKFEELEELMTRPLADTRGPHLIPKQRVQRMVAMQHHLAEMGHREGGGGGNSHSQHRVGGRRLVLTRTTVCCV